jgi:predicted transcriptional regulator
MIIDEGSYLKHYGILRRSGRYPWGSGSTQNIRNKSFLDYVQSMREKGMSETEIASGVGISTTALRAAKSIAKTQQKQADIIMAQRLHDRGLSNRAIGERMAVDGVSRNESSVRALLAPGQKDKTDILQTTASLLKEHVDNKELIDIGTGVESYLNISQTKLSTAVAMLQEEGYKIHYVKVPQVGVPGKFTTTKVLSAPGVSYSEVYKNRDNIQQITEYSTDGGRSYNRIQAPLTIDPKRVAVRYAEQGGDKADGVIYVRPGVPDVSIGNSRYAQVRIAVGDSHFIKGMAMYKDDLPPGVDLEFNTNKTASRNKLDALKKVEDDPENPFGSTIRRQILHPETGRPTSVMNMVYEQGTWETWSKSLSSQFLSKQHPSLAKEQLEMTFEQKKNSLDEIMALTNPVVRKKLLESFADDADSSAVHLKAAHLPRQASHVILPVNSLKESEIYAPNYRNGERVVLIRHPHGGTFEIPELTVNNNNREAKGLLGRAPDAVAIHHKVAARLSGADFDGDTVLVIPNNAGKVKTTPALERLKGFDPQAAYPPYEGMPKMSPRTKQIEMGQVSNLITDMTIRGAGTADLAAAVRHSMVVIDAEKHNLNYRQSAVDNGIHSLKLKYQSREDTRGLGASTLVSRATAEIRVAERTPRRAKEGGPIDKATGRKMFTPTGETYVDANGRTVVRTFRSQKLAETEDAHTLSSGTRVEKVYADHSNRLKALANEARKAAVNTRPTPYSKSAKEAYSNEVRTLDAKLNLALRNRPLERQAQIIANASVSAKQRANPDMDPSELKKVRARELLTARNRVGAQAIRIEITPDEWAAIQAGAITTNKLTQILNKADLEQVKAYATPRVNTVMTSAKQRRAEQMLAAGYTQADVADALGVALSTLKSNISREEG